jgi:DNA-directed RNA polymerase specialized sigma24 family protein
MGVGERDDAALLRGVSRGDEESLAVLYDRHAGWLTVRLTRRCALPDVVDQATQDTFSRCGGKPATTELAAMWPRLSGASASAA